MPLFLNESPARRQFKGVLGSANHLLVTILVGLSAVEKGLVTAAPPELHAAWNPKDPKSSAMRSRRVVLETTLIRATDALDIYIGYSRRKPSLIQDQSLRESIDEAQQSVARKLRAFFDHYDGVDEKLRSFVEVMVAWRNRSTHYIDDAAVPSQAWKILERNEKWLRDTFRGLELKKLSSDFDRNGPPTFKETASFIQAAQLLVEQFDEMQLNALDSKKFLLEFAWTALSKAQGRGVDGDRHRNVQSIWGRDESERLARVYNMLKGNGLSNARVTPFAAEFSDAAIEQLGALKPAEVLDYLSH